VPLSIACVGFGSLIWKPAHHADGPLASVGVDAGLVADGGSWRTDGPELPFELAREAAGPGPDRRYVAWVITPDRPRSAALWAPLVAPPDLGGDRDRAIAFAVDALGKREGAAPPGIGRWPESLADHAESATIARWATARGIDVVVWTALTPKWRGEDRAPTEAEVVTMLRGLVDEGVAYEAEEYVRKTPPQTASPYRAAIERALGWTPL
jgi:hypothetical protein